MSNEWLKARASSHLWGPGNLQTEEGEMEFPMHKRLGDIKSDLTYLFIVVCLALFQIAAKCAFSLWETFFQNKTSIFNNSALQLQ